MSEEKNNGIIDEKKLEGYREKYNAEFEKADEMSFVDELFESADYDGKPIKNWSLSDIDSLLEEVGKDSDIEEASEDFEYDKYDEYKAPKEPDFGEPESKEKEEVYDENGIYFSKEHEKDIAPKEEEKGPTEFEDIFSASEGYVDNDAESFFENEQNDDLTAVDGNINAQRDNGEFREIDESLDTDGYAVSTDDDEKYADNFDRGDYLKVKDIFKSSGILGKRKSQRAQVRESAIENVKTKFGEDIFDYQKKEADFDKILKRQAAVEKQKEQKKENKHTERRFDLDTEGYVTPTKSVPFKPVQMVADYDDNASVEEQLASFETTENKEIHDAFPDEKTKTIHFSLEREEPDEATNEATTREVEFENSTNKFRDIYITPGHVEDDEQLKLEGFPDDEEMPESVDEDVVRRQLEIARESRKDKFESINIPDNYDDRDSTYITKEKGKYDEEELLELNDEDNPKSFVSMFKGAVTADKDKRLGEYNEANEKPQIFKNLYDKRKRSLFSLMSLGALEVLLVIVTLILNSNSFAGTAAQPIVLIAVSLLAIILTFVFGSSVTQSGFKSLSKRKIDSDSAVTILLLITAADCIGMFFDLQDVGEMFPIYAVSAIFCVILNCVGRCIQNARTINALKVCANKRKDNLYLVRSIENKDDAENIGRIFSGPDPDIKYSGKVDFPTKFIFNSFSNNPADKQQKRIFILEIALSAVIGVIAGLINKNILLGLGAFTACMGVSLPVAMLVAVDFSLLFVNKTLSEEKACITGYNSVRNIEKTSAVVVNSTDIFDISRCNFHGMKDYQTVRMDDIILYAAAMLTKSRGPLAHVFDKVILGDKKELLPEVENLFYEERLGLSGWIHGQKILVGNRNLLITHNLEAPPKGDEIACRKEGKKVLYIAVDSNVAAMLIVEYAPNNEIKKYLNRLDRNGITIVVSTNDCNIDEDSLSIDFNMPRESFKVVGDYEGGLLDRYINSFAKRAPGKLIHNGKPTSYLNCVTSALAYGASVKLATVFQLIFFALGIILVAIISMTGKLTVISCGVIVLYQVLCTIISSLAGFIRSKI